MVLVCCLTTIDELLTLTLMFILNQTQMDLAENVLLIEEPIKIIQSRRTVQINI